jgi:cell division protein FtsB
LLPVEQGDVAERGFAAKRQKERRLRRRLPRRRLPRWLLPLAVFGVVGFLYVRPIHTYLQTRGQLDQRRSEVASLRAQRARLDGRLQQETSVDGLARQARRIGYVRPGEHLFIVEGTAAWAKHHGD